MNLIVDINLTPDRNDSELAEIIRKTYGLVELPDVRIERKSLDARKKDAIRYKYRAVINVDDSTADKLLALDGVSLYEPPAPIPLQVISKESHVIVVGAGSAGLFCALRLVRQGARVTLFERGKDVNARLTDIRNLEKQGILNTESNVLFGEGGAGTYSDGKLTARTKSAESIWFFRELVWHGASSDILYLAKPHIGSDLLSGIISNVRTSILEAGSSIVFSARVDALIIENGNCAGVVTSDGKEHRADAVVFAVGHSARDSYAMLAANGITLQKKSSAVGVRIEHPAELIREIQYGKSIYKNILPPAEYILTSGKGGMARGAYSFCMCPGGLVINSSSEDNMLCLNGMSESKRAGRFSNAALVVPTEPDDYRDGPLGGIEFQRSIEAAAFTAGGGGFAAPAQRLTSFLKQRVDTSLPECSYQNGIKAADIRAYLPFFICDELKNAARIFEQKMRGFITEEALIIGAETRTSSVVRILRSGEFQSVSLAGFFPTGEGAGYSGGIVSSAVDGIRTADAIIRKLQ